MGYRDHVKAWLQGHQFCAISIETTGPNPNHHEIIQIAATTVDYNFDEDERAPFYTLLKPDDPGEIRTKVVKPSRIEKLSLMRYGLDQYLAKELFEDWFNKLGLRVAPDGTSKKLLPISYDWAAKRVFIEKWLGPETFRYIFSNEYRDPLQVACYLGDRANEYMSPNRFPKKNLKFLCTRCGVELIRPHDSYQEAIAALQLYHKLLYEFTPSYRPQYQGDTSELFGEPTGTNEPEEPNLNSEENP